MRTRLPSHDQWFTFAPKSWISLATKNDKCVCECVRARDQEKEWLATTIEIIKCFVVAISRRLPSTYANDKLHLQYSFTADMHTHKYTQQNAERMDERVCWRFGQLCHLICAACKVSVRRSLFCIFNRFDCVLCVDWLKMGKAHEPRESKPKEKFNTLIAMWLWMNRNVSTKGKHESLLDSSHSDRQKSGRNSKWISLLCAVVVATETWSVALTLKSQTTTVQRSLNILSLSPSPLFSVIWKEANALK